MIADYLKSCSVQTQAKSKCAAQVSMCREAAREISLHGDWLIVLPRVNLRRYQFLGLRSILFSARCSLQLSYWGCSSTRCLLQCWLRKQLTMQTTLLWHHLEKVKPAERECHLTNADFRAVVQMSSAEFSTLPLWRQRLRWDESVSLNL